MEHLSPVMMHFYDDIIADLGLIGLGQLVGIVPTLHATMWAAYQNNFFPCRWNDDVTEGRLCVFPNA